MPMKRKPILYLIYFIILIAGFVTIILVNPLIKQNSNTDSGEVSEISNPSVNNEENKSESYASDLILHMPNRITLTKGEKIKLLDGFYSTIPQSKANEVEIKFVPYYSSDITKISFANNEIVASKTGFYKLEFSIPSSSKNSLVKSVVFEVVEANNDISKNNINMIETSNYSLSNLFNISNKTATLNISTDDLLDYDASTKTFLAKSHGQTTIKTSFVENHVEYDYYFSFNIKEKFDCEIKLTSPISATYDEENQTITSNINPTYSFKITAQYFDPTTNDFMMQPPELFIAVSEENIVSIAISDRISVTLDYTFPSNKIQKKEVVITIYSTLQDYSAEPLEVTVIFMNQNYEG